MLESLIYGYSFFVKNTRNAIWSMVVVGVSVSCGNKDSKTSTILVGGPSEQFMAQADMLELDNGRLAMTGEDINGERSADEYRITYNGIEGPGKGKHIVFIATDHEYRGEETLPALAKILAKRYGFRCTVVWALDDNGNILPGGSDLKGLDVLKGADLMVMFMRFANFEDSQMQHIDDYLNRGGAVIGLRTSTHAFKNADNPSWKHYDYKYGGEKEAWHGGFGEVVLGETWVGHYGKNHQQASKLIMEEENKEHPIMRGVQNAWAQCGGYNAYPQGKDLKILARGRVLNGMTPDAAPDTSKEELPVAWVRTYQLESGKPGRAFTTTHGASEDILSEGFRRMLINACFWGLEMEQEIKADNPIEFVGGYEPTTFNFEGYQKNVKPSDLKGWESVIMPRK
ncbi:ThuA domain-containing protein [Arenibacter sp. F20364]|uniref:ThuA domain-containing protein n=1 Tax=Arenibacter sp. F20364 TaxID=2926415 RepID=UPI001FF426EE|nr:ThuA domain-containing protein [Arenibacter sp. F20364]MCK0191525.1 ThuA domain-containing protein [Arenibacter sp. F20364]